MYAIDQFLALVNEYRRARDVSDARVSTLVFNDGSRVAQIRKGGDIGSRRLEQSIQWFSDNWPDSAKWPSCVPRPKSRAA